MNSWHADERKPLAGTVVPSKLCDRRRTRGGLINEFHSEKRRRERRTPLVGPAPQLFWPSLSVSRFLLYVSAANLVATSDFPFHREMQNKHRPENLGSQLDTGSVCRPAGRPG